MKTHNDETVFKPLSEAEQIAFITSPGDMLLFLIALERKNKEDLNKQPLADNEEIVKL